jgi:hypothetical protein
MLNKIKPEDVFTPRGKSVNKEMYVCRDVLEEALEKALRKHKNIIVHGESGSGKTWLYKRTFSELDVHFEVLNSATINQCGSISVAIERLLSSINPLKKVGYDEKKSAEANAAIIKANIENTSKYEYQHTDPYLELVRAMRGKAKTRKAFLVVENLEHIVKSESMIKELSSLLLYLDDDIYAENAVRLMLVGTPSDLRDYFAKVDESQTIINRIQEIPEVASLQNFQVSRIVEKGFFDLLNFRIVEDDESGFFDKEYFFHAISWFSANIPQYVHDICLEVAMGAEKNGGDITSEIFFESLTSWVKEALISENTRIEKNINSRETHHGRRNQVIYVAGHISTKEFSNNEIESFLRSTFPISTSGKTLNISAILIQLSAGDCPILRKTSNANQYRFIDPKLRIMARYMLSKEKNESVTVRKFDEGLAFGASL